MNVPVSHCRIRGDCFILRKMGTVYNTYERAELRVSHWVVGVRGPYLRQKVFEGQWEREGLDTRGGW